MQWWCPVICPGSVPGDGTILVKMTKSLGAHRVCPAFGTGQWDGGLGQIWEGFLNVISNKSGGNVDVAKWNCGIELV